MSKTPDFNYNRMLSDVISSKGKPVPLPETGWHLVGVSEADGIPFSSSWENATPSGDDSAPAAWHTSEDGEVRLRGIVKNVPGDDDYIFQLPEESRPEKECFFLVPYTSDNDGSNLQLTLDGIRLRSWENGRAWL